MLTEQEHEVLHLLAEAYNAYTKLEITHIDHPTEFRYAIHQAERVVMVRSVKRVLDKEAGQDMDEQEEVGNG